MWYNYHPPETQRLLCQAGFSVTSSRECWINPQSLGGTCYSATFNYLVVNKQNHGMNSDLFCGLYSALLCSAAGQAAFEFDQVSRFILEK